MPSTKPLRLSTSDREFFSWVTQATFANPFGDERPALDRKILGEVGESVTSAERARWLHERVSERLVRLQARGAAELADFAAEDQETLRSVFLFDVYYDRFSDLNAHIEEQLRVGDEPCPLSCASAALESLRRRGFSEDEADHYLALLFQLRRAYYFIDEGLTGSSESMRALRRQLWNSVVTYDLRWYDRVLVGRMEDFSTLLLGETGTGKGTAAAAIGRAGWIPFDRSRGRFVESFTHAFLSVNLSQFPEPLIEAELFGHRRGAFTGAVEDREGLFARCSPHGAVLLDEIGELSVPIQIKLLQVLQERWFVPVGGNDKQRFAGRVIAATNRPLRDLRGADGFRDDFFYRLCSNIIHVPSLRQRLEEDPEELDSLLYRTLYRMAGESTADLFDTIRDSVHRSVPPGYGWPGNVRELEQCVRRILLTREYVPDPLSSGEALAPLEQRMHDGELTAQALLAGYCAWLYSRVGTLAEVARRTQLDRRTVRKYLEMGS